MDLTGIFDCCDGLRLEDLVDFKSLRLCESLGGSSRVDGIADGFRFEVQVE